MEDYLSFSRLSRGWDMVIPCPCSFFMVMEAFNKLLMKVRNFISLGSEGREDRGGGGACTFIFH